MLNATYVLSLNFVSLVFLQNSFEEHTLSTSYSHLETKVKLSNFLKKSEVYKISENIPHFYQFILHFSLTLLPLFHVFVFV